MKRGLIILFFLLLPASLLAGTRVINYGFEDWSGWNENSSPANGWIFSTGEVGYFAYQTLMTNAVNNGTAYEGNYFFHRQFCGSVYDALLGSTTPSGNDYIDTRGYVGMNGTYPTGTKDATSLQTAITSNTCTVRFYFRVNGNWKSTAATGWCKLVWMRGGGQEGSYGCVHLIPGDYATTYVSIYDQGGTTWETYHYTTDSGIDLQDGNWHSMAVKYVRNNDVGTTGNLSISYWVDDWDMSGAGVSHTTTSSNFGAYYSYFTLATNFSNTFPSAAMGIDLDKVEVWDGIPDAEEEPPALQPNMQGCSLQGGGN